MWRIHSCSKTAGHGCEGRNLKDCYHSLLCLEVFNRLLSLLIQLDYLKLVPENLQCAAESVVVFYNMNQPTLRIPAEGEIFARSIGMMTHLVQALQRLSELDILLLKVVAHGAPTKDCLEAGPNPLTLDQNYSKTVAIV